MKFHIHLEIFWNGSVFIWGHLEQSLRTLTVVVTSPEIHWINSDSRTAALFARHVSTIFIWRHTGYVRDLPPSTFPQLFNSFLVRQSVTTRYDTCNYFRIFCTFPSITLWYSPAGLTAAVLAENRFWREIQNITVLHCELCLLPYAFDFFMENIAQYFICISGLIIEVDVIL